MKTFGFKLDATTARQLRSATGERGQSAALRAAMSAAVASGVMLGLEGTTALPRSEEGQATLTLRVSDDLAAAWTALVGEQRQSVALRSIAAAVASQPQRAERPGAFSPPSLPYVPPVARDARATLTLHLAEGLRDELVQQATDLGVTPARWTAAWLSVRLSGKPLFAGDHAHAIRQVANELAAIGRNVNSIARAMNVEAAKSRVRDLEIADVQRLAAEVMAFRKEVGQLVSDQLAYWTGDHA